MDLTHVRFEGRPTLRSRPPRAGWAHRLQVRRDVVPPAAGPALRADGFPALILDRNGLDPAAYRAGPLERRIAACLRALGVRSEQAARARLEERPELLGKALSTVLIGVSSFFRDALVFETLRGAIAERARPLRVLSLGCSTGAELYSIGILLREQELLEHSRLVGIDCRPDAVASARHGVFAEEELDGIDEAARVRHFERADRGWRVAEPIRRAARWQVGDATRAHPAGPWDLVVCRNVFIYLQPPVVDAMLGRMTEALSPGGLLVVGKAERPCARLPLTAIGRCVYRKHDG